MDIRTQKTWRQLLVHFINLYPFRATIILIAFLIAGIAETIGIGALMPLLNIVLEIDTPKDNLITKTVNAMFTSLGLQQNFQNLLLIIVITITLKAIIIFQAMKSVSYISADITYDLRKNFINAILHAKWNYFSSLDVGKSANAIATEADYAGQFCMIAGKTISSALQALIYIMIAFMIDWKISIAAIIMGAFVAFVLKFLITMARDSGNEMTIVQNNLISRLTASLTGAKPIIAMGEEDRYVDLLNKDTAGLQNARKKLALSSLLLTLVHEPILVILMAVGLLWAYSYADYPISELFMMAFLFNRLLSQVNLVQNNYQKTSIFEGAVNAILEKTHDAEQAYEINTGKKTPNLEKEIRMENLSLCYGSEDIIKDLSKAIPAHKITVIFGPSGSGKTTILDSIIGLKKPTNGSILIDDVNINDINIKQWRKKIGYVPQETFLFHDTIRQNVSLGERNISDEVIIEALKASNAWDFVSQIPEGIDYIVGERGGKLSGGQRQRIALARALVRNPELLILDEATSGLDKENEQQIIEAMKNRVSKTTILMISHDPDILKTADHVIHLGSKGTEYDQL